MSGQINISDTWVDISDVKINIADTWQTAKEGWINAEGYWSQWWPLPTTTTTTSTTLPPTTTTTTTILNMYQSYFRNCSDCSAAGAVFNFGTPLTCTVGKFYNYGGNTTLEILSVGGTGEDGNVYSLIGPYDSCALACNITTTTTTPCSFNVNYTETPQYLNTTSANGGGQWLCNSGTIWSYGICWNTTGTPTVLSDSSASIGGPDYSINKGFYYDLTMTPISISTTYYVRAFAYDTTYHYGPQVTYTHTAQSTTTTTIVGTTTTTTICTRPGGLTYAPLIKAWQNNSSEFHYFFSGTASDACISFGNFIKDPLVSVYGMVNTGGEFSSLAVGQTFYLGYGYTNCNTVINGNYWYSSSLSSSPDIADVHNLSCVYIVTITSGQISAISSACCPTTTTTTTIIPFELYNLETPQYINSTTAGIITYGVGCDWRYNYGRITKIGLCWNTTGSPTIGDTKNETLPPYGESYPDGYTQPYDQFTCSDMTGLTYSQRYYVKAYAYRDSYGGITPGYTYSNQIVYMHYIP